MNKTNQTEMRCNKYGDFPDGRHVMEIKNEFLNTAELQLKRIAFAEAHEDFPSILQSAEDQRRIGGGM